MHDVMVSNLTLTAPILSWPMMPEGRAALCALLVCISITTLARLWAVTYGMATLALLGALYWGVIDGRALGAILILWALCRKNCLAWLWGRRMGVLWGAWLMSGFVPGYVRLIYDQAWLVKTGCVVFAPEIQFTQVLTCWLMMWAYANEMPVLLPCCSRLLWRALVPTVAVICVLMGLALGWHKITFQFATLGLVPLFVLHNVLLVVVPEEIFFRGVVPCFLREHSATLKNRPRALMAAESLVFGAAHGGSGPLMVVLSTVAGVGYAAAGAQSRSLLGSVMAHAAVNLTHFLWFSYPALE